MSCTFLSPRNDAFIWIVLVVYSKLFLFVIRQSWRFCPASVLSIFELAEFISSFLIGLWIWSLGLPVGLYFSQLRAWCASILNRYCSVRTPFRERRRVLQISVKPWLGSRAWRFYLKTFSRWPTRWVEWLSVFPVLRKFFGFFSWMSWLMVLGISPFVFNCGFWMVGATIFDIFEYMNPAYFGILYFLATVIKKCYDRSK